MATNYRYIIEPLVEYTREKLGDLDKQKEAAIRLVYEIIREAICDLHGDDTVLKQDARKYFESETFEFHCTCAAIPTNVMEFIAFNPKRKQAFIKQDKEVYNESVR